MQNRFYMSMVAASFATCGLASAADYDESIDGDLGNQTSGPTFFDVGIGTNSVSGTVGGADFEDFIAFTIDAGEQLTAVTLTSFTPANGNTSTGFRLYTDQGAGFFQASAGLFDAGDVGTNYLDTWDLTDVGGSAPLGPGTYGVLLAEFTDGQAYSFDLTVVPAPASIAMFGLGGLAFARRRR